MASSASLPPMNPWETRALDYQFPETIIPEPEDTLETVTREWRQGQDSVIYPGLYSATGFDIMNVLLHVTSRQNPTIELGPVDCSVALILCDLDLPDSPIVYVSDSFCYMTGYTKQEIIGRNCRFLQTPHGRDQSAIKPADKLAVQQMKQAMQSRQEIQIELTNYKKSGQPFTNLLSIVPLKLDPNGHQLAVGFQVELC